MMMMRRGERRRRGVDEDDDDGWDLGRDGRVRVQVQVRSGSLLKHGEEEQKAGNGRQVQVGVEEVEAS